MGLYVLLDYINFKGEGTSETEAYQGQGWGLLQVLQAMPKVSSDQEIIADFVAAAKKVLEQRVKNSPPKEGRRAGLKDGTIASILTFKSHKREIIRLLNTYI